MFHAHQHRREHIAVGTLLNSAIWLLGAWFWFLPTQAAAQFTVNGKVTTNSGTAVAQAEVAFTGSDGAVAATTSTADDGSYAVQLAADTYSLKVTPPATSSLLTQTQSGISVSSNKTLDVVLVDVGPAAYAGTLVDSYGTPIVGATVMLRDHDFTYSDTTDQTGAFSMTASTGATQLSANCQGYGGHGCSHFSAQGNGYHSMSFPEVDLRAGSVTDAALVWPVRTLSGNVTDGDGVAVGGARISWNGSGYSGAAAWDAESEWYNQIEAFADANGDFTILVGPGTGTLGVEAPADSGLSNLSEALTISADVEPAALTLALDAAPSYAGTLVDSYGTPITGATVMLRDNDFTYSDTTDHTGAFSITAGTGATQLSANCQGYQGHGCTHFNPQGNGYHSMSFPDIDLSAGSVTDAALIWPVRTLSGSVTDDEGAVVGGAGISWNGSGYSGAVAWDAESEWYNQIEAFADANGDFTFLVGPGMGTLAVEAPADSGLSNLSEALTISADAEPAALTLVLDAAPSYTGTLVDSDGTPIVGATIMLRDNDFTYSDTTDHTGAFSITAGTGATQLSANCQGYQGHGCTHFSPQGSGYHSMSFPDIDLSAGSVTDAALVWPVRTLSVSVTDIDGLAVGSAHVSWNGSGYSGPTSWESESEWYNQIETATDASGQLTVLVGPGAGKMEVRPEAESGLTPFAISRTVTSDATLAVLVQFATEALSQDVGAGGTVTSDPEGDGATPSDPVETVVLSAVAGTVSIQEVPITQEPPSGVQFLTQQVSITAPEATAANAIRIAFLLDASRVPPDHDHTTIDMYRNGVLVGECPGSAVAIPDPCVTTRELVDEGDVHIVVLTSMASQWNFGVGEMTAACDSASDCDDGDSCTLDNCHVGSCTHTASTDPVCASECDGADDCGDGDSCTLDACDAGHCTHAASTDPVCTGECSQHSDCEDGDSCTVDACVAGYCTYAASSDPTCASECSRHTDCEDGDSCTVDACVAGYCTYAASTDPICAGGCSSHADCDDGNDCSLDACDAGRCQYTESPAPACTAQCIDGEGCADPWDNEEHAASGTRGGCSLADSGANAPPTSLLFVGIALLITRSRRERKH